MTGALFELAAGEAPLRDAIKRTAELSRPEPDGRVLFRWRLTYWWRPGPRILFLGHNPAGADGRRDDPTTLRWTHFGARWGFGSWDAGNLYPYRTPDPVE